MSRRCPHVKEVEINLLLRVPRVTIRTNEKILTDDEMNLEENANGLSSGNKLSTSKNDKRHKIDEWNVASKRLTGSAKRLKALAVTLSQVRATYDKLRKEYLKLYKEFKSTNTTRPPSKLISGDHSNIDSPLLHINKSRILSNLKALTRLTGMLSRMINVQKKNDSKVVKFQTSKITETPVKNLSQDHKSGVHKNGDMENKATTLISEVKQLMKLKGRHSKPHRNSFKSTRIYPGRMANEDRYHGAIPSDRRKESKTAMTNKKIESHNKNRERTKLGVHNAETSPIKVESATKTAEVPHHTPSSIDESSRKEIPRLISDIEASDNRHNEGGNNEADGSALKPSSTKKDSSSNVNILTKKAQSIKGTGQPADNEDSVEDLVENLKKEYKKVNPPRAMPIPKSYIEDDEKEAMSSVTSMKPITQPPTSTRKVKGKTQHVMKPHVEVGKWNDGTSIRTAEACELVECDFEEGSLCSYESTKDELSPSSRQYLQRTRRFTHKIRRSWHNWRGRYRNRLTGIAHSKIFSGSNKRFAAAYVRPHQWAALSTKLISGEAETIRFSAWEATLGVQLHGCCDTTSNCPFHTELGASRRSRRWMEWTFTCPKRTSKLIFLCENQGINQGACGIDSISLVNDSCKSRLATLRHAENRM
uniref:Uncharacterized protein n=1 Tax=Parascaris univalens TaxID=6257 RepID=A0A915B7N2_PARUN